MAKKTPLISGQIPTILVKMSPIGDYHLADINWQVEFYASRGKVVIEKAKAKKIDEDSYTVRVDTTNIGLGELHGILYPSIPDLDMEDGVYTPPIPFETEEIIVDKYNKRNGMCHY
ncbi:MAG: hypothetical protein U0K81_05110 [Paludibacteraceae bacterium]|nr:hypothetical protein [Paludibacteraceae bacterium]